MQTKVERGQVSEDRVTGAIGATDRHAPLQPVLGLGARVDSGFSGIEGNETRPLGALRRPVGCTLLNSGLLQQDGEAAWQRCQRR